MEFKGGEWRGERELFGQREVRPNARRPRRKETIGETGLLS